MSRGGKLCVLVTRAEGSCAASKGRSEQRPYGRRSVTFARTFEEAASGEGGAPPRPGRLELRREACVLVTRAEGAWAASKGRGEQRPYGRRTVTGASSAPTAAKRHACAPPAGGEASRVRAASRRLTRVGGTPFAMALRRGRRYVSRRSVFRQDLISANDLSRRRRASSTSAFEMFMGGARRMTLAKRPPLPMSRPLARARSRS